MKKRMHWSSAKAKQQRRRVRQLGEYELQVEPYAAPKVQGEGK